MKILIGMPSKDSWGGPISSEPPFAEALRALGHEVTEEIYVYGDKEKPTPTYERFRRVIATARRFRKILSKGDFDIVHLNTAFDKRTILRDSFSLWLMRPGKTKVFLKFHGSEAQRFFNTKGLIKFLMMAINKRADAIGIHTSEEKENFLKLGFEESKFHFCKNVVTLSERIPKGYVRKHRKANETFQLLFVSRFIAQKGLLETIQACQILKEKGIKFILYCLGDGEIKADAETLVTELGLERNVQFTGYIPESDVERYFFDTDIFIFPTRFGEGFPNVFFKAAAAGMPIVSTRFRAAADYLKDGENYLACESTPESIAVKIEQLINYEELRRLMSENNMKYGRSLLPENIAREYVAIYEKIIK